MGRSCSKGEESSKARSLNSSTLNSSMKITSNPLLLTTKPPPELFVVRCSDMYKLLWGFLSGSFAFIQVMLATTNKAFWGDIAWIVSPTGSAAAFTFVFLQPRNETPRHRIHLWWNATLAIVLPDAIQLIVLNRDSWSVTVALIRIPIGLALFKLCLIVRARAAKLPDKLLSRFLTDSLLMQSLITIGVMIFFAIDPIRCWAEFPDEKSVCKRTLYSQAGLGCIILAYYCFAVVNSAFPKTIISNHTISLRKIAIGDLTTRENVRVCIDFFVLCCAFFLFAQYNSRGRMNKGEGTLLVAVAGIGTGLLIIGGCWEWFAMLGEARAMEEGGAGEEEGGEGKEEVKEKVVENVTDLPPILKLHQSFQISGLVLTLATLVLGILSAVTKDRYYSTLQLMLIPFVTLLFFPAFFADPRSQSATFEKVLFASFTASEIPLVVYNIRIGTHFPAITLTRFCIWGLCLVYGLSWRRKIANLPDEELSNFFLNSVLKNVIKNITGMLFVTFRSLNCVIENMSFRVCSKTSACSMYLALYLVIFIIIKMVVGTMSERQRREDQVSWEKLASMKELKLWHKCSGVLVLVTGVISMFLFCLQETADRR